MKQNLAKKPEINSDETEIYFAVSKEMIEQYSMPYCIEGGYCWKLDWNSYLGYIISDNPGDVINELKECDKYALCKAAIKTKDLISAFCCMLGGGSYNANVRVVEMSTITKE